MKESILKENFASQIAKGAGITFTGDVIGKGLYFVSQVVVARLLGVEKFGLYALGLIIFNIAQTLSGIGLSQGAVRYVSIFNGNGDSNKVKGIIILSMGLPFLVGTILSLLIFYNAGTIANIFGNSELTKIIKIITIGIPFMSAMMVSISATRGFKKMQYYVYVKNFFHPVCNLILIWVLALIGYELLGAITAWIFSAVLGFFLSIYYLAKEFPQLLKVKASFITKELLKYSLPLVLVGFLQMLFIRVDILMLGYFCDSYEIGIYNATTQIVTPLCMIMFAFASVFSPIVAELYAKSQILRLNSLIRQVSKWTFLLTLPVFMILVFSSKEILHLFGPDFSSGRSALLILCVFNFVSFGMGPMFVVLLMSGKQKFEFYNAIIAFILNFLLNLLLIPKFGIIGAAFATGISLLTLFIVRLLETKHFLKFWPMGKKHLMGLLGGILGTILISYLKTFIPSTNYIISFTINLLLVGSFFVGFIFFHKLNEEEKLIIQTIRNKFL